MKQHAAQQHDCQNDCQSDRQNDRHANIPHRNILALALLAALSQTVHAQESEGDAATLDAVRVTGIGTNIEGIQPVGSKSLSVEREAMAATGMATVLDVIRTLPQIQNNDTYSEGGTAGSANSVQANTLNLRGIGPRATLLLIDGHRVAPTGTSRSFTEANQIPMIALERVEVIADGASAIYGSDAVAGIVNYVMRKDYEGAEVSYRFADQGGFYQRTGSVLAGVAWGGGIGHPGGGNLVIAYERTDRDALRSGKNPLLRQDLSGYGNPGPDWRLNANNATPGFNANIVVPRGDRNPDLPQAGNFDYYAIPPGSDGIGLSAADLLYNQPNLIDAADYSDYIGQMKRDQYSLNFNQQVTDWLSVYTQVLHRERSTISYTMSNGSGIQYNSRVSVPASSPWYISGIPGVAPGAPLTVQYNAYKDVGPGHYPNDEKQTTWTAGVKADFAGEWRGEFYYTGSKNEACGVCVLETYINWDGFYAQVAAGHINPFSREPLSDAQKSTFVGSNVQSNVNKLHDAVLKFNGPLFDLAGGKVRAAVGGEYNKNSIFMINEAHRGNGNIYFRDTAAYMERDIKSMFAEVYVPLVGAGNAVTGIQALNLNAAVRHDRYSDVGNTTNPKFGLTWEVNDALSFRGSWGKSFRAPALQEMDPFVSSNRNLSQMVNNSGDPQIVDGVSPGLAWQLTMGRARTTLVPETAKSWSAGIDYDFPMIEGLRLSATYYNIAYENRIDEPPINEFYSSPENYAIWSAYITPIHNPANCVANDQSTWDPALVAFMNLPALYGNMGSVSNAFSSNPNISPCLVNVVTDGRHANMAATEQAGLDLELNWAIPSDIGFWTVGASTTRVLKHDQQLVAGLPMSDRRGMYNEPSSIRARANVGWYLGDWGAHLFANYIGSYTNDLPISWAGVRHPEHRVGSWTTWDLGVSWSPMLETKWLHGIRVGFNVNNILDRDPPIVLSGSNPFGRTWAVSVALNY